MLRTFKLAVDATKLDPFELDPISTREKFEYGLKVSVVSRSIRKKARNRRIKGKLRRSAIRCMKFLFMGRQRLTPILEDAIVFVCFTRNQHHALQPIIEELSRTTLVQKISNDDILEISRRKAKWWMPLFAPLVLSKWFSAKGYQRKTFRWGAVNYLKAYGLHIEFRRWMRQNRPQAVILSNDHVSIYCVLRAAAMAEGIPTIYVQHACVTQAFPPLKFNYALLDGLDALNKYNLAGPSTTKISLIGITKMDKALSSETYIGTGARAGLSFNPIDTETEIKRSILKLSSASTDMKWVVRPHPGMVEDVRIRIKELAVSKGIGFSDPLLEGPTDFLKQLNVLVCGSSSIACEAAILGVQPIVIMHSDVPDSYGFVENGLAIGVSTTVEAIRVAHARRFDTEKVRRNAAYYCNTLGTPYEGRSSELAAKIILKAVNPAFEIEEDVEKVTSVPVTARNS